MVTCIICDRVQQTGHRSDLEAEVLEIGGAGGACSRTLQQIGRDVSPCLAIPDVSDGLGTHAVMSSKHDTAADLLAERIRSQSSTGCQIFQSIYISGLALCQDELMS